MHRIILFVYLVFIVLKTNAQNTTFNNVAIGTDGPTYGVKIKTNFPGYTGGWARFFSVSDHVGGQDFITFGTYGEMSNGVTGFNRSYIGKNWEDTFIDFSSNGNVGIGTKSPSAKLSILGGISKLTLNGIDGTFDNIIKYGHKSDLESGTSMANRWHGIDATITAGNANENKLKFRLYPGGFSNAIPLDVLTLQGNGNVGIGTTSPAHKLDVIGTIRSREVKVDMDGADFVFEEKYPLMPLTELEAYVKKNKHLPEIATAKEMQEQGSNLGDLNTKLLQKIEELTLYVIEQQKLITQQAKELESHKVMLAKIDQMEKTLAKMNTANEK
ncbi:DUF3450 domain-containing protein [Flavobacterium sp. CECT 9288]|uniref:DUF3450 domain-containing protein n=1 Tax=Flavobacterium sp. CECT 9288 TaxID=2845819 RepID=UPI001E65BB98|nr:DUF3450 domain-containing protein [Flavobacterium sp. CECT 9288]